MYVRSVPRRLKWYGELLEPLGLRWEYESWVEQSEVARGGRNTPLPPDAWHLLYLLAYERIHGSERPVAGRPKMLHLRAWNELAHAVGDRYRHPAISGVAFGAYPGTYDPLPHLCVWRDVHFRRHPFHTGEAGLAVEVMVLRPVIVKGVGQCYHYVPAPVGYEENVPWRHSDPANPWIQWEWALRKNQYAREHPR